ELGVSEDGSVKGAGSLLLKQFHELLQAEVEAVLLGVAVPDAKFSLSHSSCLEGQGQAGCCQRALCRVLQPSMFHSFLLRLLDVVAVTGKAVGVERERLRVRR